LISRVYSIRYSEPLSQKSSILKAEVVFHLLQGTPHVTGHKIRMSSLNAHSFIKALHSCGYLSLQAEKI